MNAGTWTAPTRPLMDDPEETVEISYRYPTLQEALDYTLQIASTSEQFPAPQAAPGEAEGQPSGGATRGEEPASTSIRRRVAQIKDAVAAVLPLITGIKVRGVAIPGDLAEYASNDVRFTRHLEADAGWLFRLTPSRGGSGD